MVPLREDRAVSTAVGYTLTLGIMTLLITGLLIAGGGFVEDQRERTIRAELQVVGQQIAADLDAADRLARADGTDTTVEVRHQHPERVTGASYTVEVDNCDSNRCLKLSTEDPEIEVTVRIGTVIPVSDGDVSGGDLTVQCLDKDNDDVCDTNADGDVEGLEVTNG